MKEAHCLEILHNIVKDVKATELRLVSANYTAEGLTAALIDMYDNQTYEFIIKPIKEDPVNKM